MFQMPEKPASPWLGIPDPNTAQQPMMLAQNDPTALQKVAQSYRVANGLPAVPGMQAPISSPSPTERYPGFSNTVADKVRKIMGRRQP